MWDEAEHLLKTTRDARWGWIIETTWRGSGDVAYWGRGGLTAFRGNALRYESEAAALHVAYERKVSGDINDFIVWEIVKPRMTGTNNGQGGRA